MRRRRRGRDSELLLALIAGIALGLVYAWLIAPVEYVDASPAMLRSDFRDRYRAVIAASYAASGDLDRARARLNLLGEADVAGALNGQAQQMLAAGEPIERVQQVAQLGADIGPAGPPPTSTPQAATETLAPTVTLPSSAAGTPGPEDATRTAPVPVIPIAVHTSTPRPTYTPTLTPGAPFALLEQEQICDSDSRVPMLQVMVLNAGGVQVPGAEVIVTWADGEDHFFTGFKPERGHGFADFLMVPGTLYTARVSAGGLPVSDLAAPACVAPSGESYDGGLRLTFQQP
jgi:hypothetical protein